LTFNLFGIMLCDPDGVGAIITIFQLIKKLTPKGSNILKNNAPQFDPRGVAYITKANVLSMIIWTRQIIS
ncbi:MAG: hypothetical protein MH132_01570, partial [Hydrotalea sp.]|nr:hypothetical protein [Hydrotalea sp.]